MKAIVYRKYGSPIVLEPVEVEKPIPGPKEILIRVCATTVTSADCMMRRGDTVLSRILLGLRKPMQKYQILGTEFSGVIEAVGSHVKTFKIADEVYGFRGFGTGCYAEYKCMPENGSLAKKPVNMSFEEAASLVDGATTALFFLKDKAHIQKGQKVLINGASGSIGTFAVQLAKYFGAEVTAVCSNENIELARLLGADYVVDYTKKDFTRGADTYDIIFDTVGKSSFRKCRNVLTKKGKYVVTVLTFKHLILSFLTKIGNKKRVVFSMSINKTEALEFIRKLTVEGKLITIIDKQFPFDKLPEAHAYVEKGHKKGNVVIDLGS
ncbi:MAG: NAD(P)-dependent alcohol dehydrogenase [Bacteroidetes bacterium]|nr:NAD(P)-dependent alcohol dehydrogenase [Bacteroidota bacterium]